MPVERALAETDISTDNVDNITEIMVGAALTGGFATGWKDGLTAAAP